MTDTERNEAKPIQPIRRYKSNQYLIPTEFQFTEDKTVFRTSDKEQYIRNTETGVIYSVKKKKKGKAARKLDKKMRRLSK